MSESGKPQFEKDLVESVFLLFFWRNRVFFRESIKAVVCSCLLGESMKKTGLTLILLLALFSVLVGVNVVKVAKSSYPLSSGINIISPSNRTYSPSLFVLNVSMVGLLGKNINVSMYYSLDGKDNLTLPIEIHTNQMSFQVSITGFVTLPELSEGSHTVKVYEESDAYNVGVNGVFYPKYVDIDNNAVYFTINDGNPPIISDLSVENKTYNQNDLSLNFTTDEPTLWVGYCLDGKANITIFGNTTLTRLSDGSHSLVIYANDTAGNAGASEIVTFSVDTPKPFPAAYSMSIVAVIVLVLLGSIVYILKRK